MHQHHVPRYLGEPPLPPTSASVPMTASRPLSLFLSTAFRAASAQRILWSTTWRADGAGARALKSALGRACRCGCLSFHCRHNGAGLPSKGGVMQSVHHIGPHQIALKSPLLSAALVNGDEHTAQAARRANAHEKSGSFSMPRGATTGRSTCTGRSRKPSSSRKVSDPGGHAILLAAVQ